MIHAYSIFGKQPGGGMIDYNATKAAAIRLITIRADEVAKDNVQINVECTEPVQTVLWMNATQEYESGGSLWPS